MAEHRLSVAHPMKELGILVLSRGDSIRPLGCMIGSRGGGDRTGNTNSL